MLILGSESKSRLDLLQSAGLSPHKIIPPNINEDRSLKEDTLTYVTRMATDKSKSIETTFSDLLITADTIVVCKNQIFHKTDDREKAFEYINNLSGKRHSVYTAVCLRYKDYFKCHLEKSVLKMRRLTMKEINNYLDRNEWRGCAGAYNIRGTAISMFPFISGCYTNIIGLPVPKIFNILKGIGYTDNETSWK